MDVEKSATVPPGAVRQDVVVMTAERLGGFERRIGTARLMEAREFIGTAGETVRCEFQTRSLRSNGDAVRVIFSGRIVALPEGVARTGPGVGAIGDERDVAVSYETAIIAARAVGWNPLDGVASSLHAGFEALASQVVAGHDQRAGSGPVIAMPVGGHPVDVKPIVSEAVAGEDGKLRHVAAVVHQGRYAGNVDVVLSKDQSQPWQDVLHAADRLVHGEDVRFGRFEEDMLDRDVVDLVAAASREGSVRYLVETPNRATFEAAMQVFRRHECDPARVASTIGDLFENARSVEIGTWDGGTRIVFGVSQSDRSGPRYPVRRATTPEQRIAYAQRVIDWALKVVGAAWVRVHECAPSQVETTNEPGADPWEIHVFWR